MNKRNLILIIGAILLCSTTSIATVAVYRNFDGHHYTTSSTTDTAPVQFASMSNTQIGQTDLTIAAERTVHSVVHVKVKQKARSNEGAMDGFNDPFFEFFFGQPDNRRYYEPETTTGAGSGVIISADGYIVTNNHVINNASEIEVTLNDKRTFTAKVIGADPTTDIALIKIDANDLQPMAIGNSDNLKIGEWVLAIGNPFNLTSTVTAGIVSAKSRNLNLLNADPRGQSIESFIQTDAAINPGNSGGALVNAAGELVGINTAIASLTGTYNGYGFAVPTTIVSKVVKDLREYGTVQRAILGVRIDNIDDKLAKEKNIKTLDGVYVASIEENSAAKDAGIKEGDVITAINGVKVKSTAELQEQVAAYRPGNAISVTIMRKNSEQTLRVKLKNLSGNTNIVKDTDIAELGADFAPLPMQTKRQLNYNGGLMVQNVRKNGAFAKAGIENGFIVLKINNKPVSSTADIKDAYNTVINSNDTDKVLFVTVINRAGVIKHYIVTIK